MPSTKSKVAVVFSSPGTVLDDIAVAMNLADYSKYLVKNSATSLKINISWQHYYPACSTTPWQLEGVIRCLQNDGYKNLVPTHNGIVVVHAREGAWNNKHTIVEDKYDLEEAEWVDFVPKAPMMALDKIYPNGFKIPELLFGKNIVHLPTVKTHVFTTITGAMKTDWGELFKNY